MRKPKAPDVRIEYPSQGATYTRWQYGVYEYGVYPRHSVLAGQQQRVFLDSYDTLEEAQRAYPNAQIASDTGYTPPSLEHLPDDGDY